MHASSSLSCCSRARCSYGDWSSPRRSSFPKLGQSFYELGPGRTIKELTAVFRRLDRRNLLRIPDAARAASDFNWLIMSEPINKAMLLGNDQPPSRSSINRWADQAVRTFLAAYRIVDDAIRMRSASAARVSALCRTHRVRHRAETLSVSPDPTRGRAACAARGTSGRRRTRRRRRGRSPRARACRGRGARPVRVTSRPSSGLRRPCSCRR